MWVRSLRRAVALPVIAMASGKRRPLDAPYMEVGLLLRLVVHVQILSGSAW
jgi:hypothetical protein